MPRYIVVDVVVVVVALIMMILVQERMKNPLDNDKLNFKAPTLCANIDNDQKMTLKFMLV
jgi:hypothetical protein